MLTRNVLGLLGLQRTGLYAGRSFFRSVPSGFNSVVSPISLPYPVATFATAAKKPQEKAKSKDKKGEKKPAAKAVVKKDKPKEKSKDKPKDKPKVAKQTDKKIVKRVEDKKPKAPAKPPKADKKPTPKKRDAAKEKERIERQRERLRVVKEKQRAADKEKKEKEKEKKKAAVLKDKEKKKVQNEKDKQKALKEKKRKEKEAKPKRSLSAFFHYANEARPVILQENPELRVTQVLQHVAEKWNALSAVDKKKYEDLAASDKERYMREKAEYEATRPKKYTSYSVFIKDSYAGMHQEHPDLPMSEVGKLLAVRWNSLTAEEKQGYEEKAKEMSTA